MSDRAGSVVVVAVVVPLGVDMVATGAFGGPEVDAEDKDRAADDRPQEEMVDE